MGDFEADTRLEALPGEAGGYRAVLSRDWEIWGPNGGYLAAIALRAAGREAAIPRPAAFAGHFLAVGRFAPAEVRVEVLRRGRRAESLRVTVAQDERRLLEALVRTAAEAPGLEHVYERAPRVPGPETLPPVDELRDPDAPRHAFWKNLEARPVDPARVNAPPASRDPLWTEWYRFRPRATFDEPFLDAGRSLLLVDTLSWPAAVQPHPDAAYLAPNLDVTAWFHDAAPESEWLLADHACPVARGGLMGTTGRVWSRDGRLLASGGAQLLCTPAPDAG